jgi:hypothetical protein
MPRFRRRRAQENGVGASPEPQQGPDEPSKALARDERRREEVRRVLSALPPPRRAHVSPSNPRALDRPVFVRLSTGRLDASEPGHPWWRYRRPDETWQPRSDGAPPAGAATEPALGDGTGDGAATIEPASETPAEPTELGDPPSSPSTSFSSSSSGLPFAILAALLAGLLHLAAGAKEDTHLGRILVPVFAFLVVAAFVPLLRQRHWDEPWLPKLLYAGVAAKIVASLLRYHTLVDGYGNVGDATEYHQFAVGYVHGNPKPLTDLRKTNFIRWFTGVTYKEFGIDIVAGFLIFSVIAVVGSYLWYRATADSVPFINKRMYFCFVMFMPSIAFWPSSIGKEALMQFGLGAAALGAANLLRQRLVRGLLIGAPGAWILWVVRPHLLAFAACSTGLAYVVGRRRRPGETEIRGSLVRPLGLVLVALIAVWAVTQAATFLGMPDFSLKSIEQTLSEQTAKTSQGGSQIETGGEVHLTPLSLPQGAVTVLLRPFPWEVDSAFQIFASLEAAAITLLIILRWRCLTTSLRHIRSSPFLFYCWTLIALYSITFSSFANMGLLVRQRSLVLPALFVILCINVEKAHAYSARLARPRDPADRALA